MTVQVDNPCKQYSGTVLLVAANGTRAAVQVTIRLVSPSLPEVSESFRLPAENDVNRPLTHPFVADLGVLGVGAHTFSVFVGQDSSGPVWYLVGSYFEMTEQ
jgi:hypothetical protein